MANEQVFAEDINKETEIHYKKDKKLGEGTYAVVYLGYDNRTGRKVAIKKIKLGSMKNGLDMSAIREIKALRELQHPNVIEKKKNLDFSSYLAVVNIYISIFLVFMFVASLAY
ncbi:Serine/threonine-protein kinase KIN28 [Smittium culicis]|uniref:[RNA-polymerase]-subunit kinase n=1 Tax=Smittium culicis TaxID=133412 RepID=A0A1R1XQU3_9FUNG|nr:Serine/threonine-protein kinase KIN28 [Smittium culicis]